MNTQVYSLILLLLSITLAYPMTDYSSLTDEEYAVLGKRALNGMVIAGGARLLRRANRNPKKKQKIGHGVSHNNYLGNALQNQLVAVDSTGIRSSSKGRAKVIEAIKKFKEKRASVTAAKVFEYGGKYDFDILSKSGRGLSSERYKKLPIFTDYAENIDRYKEKLASPMTPGDEVFFIEQLSPSYEELAKPGKPFRLPYSLIQLTGITIKRFYNTVSMDPMRGLKIFEAAERLGRAIFDDPRQRNKISDRILSRVREQINDALNRDVKPITQIRADQLLELTKAKLDNFRKNGSGEKMGFKVHPDNHMSVGHWHCRIFAVLKETEKGKGDQTHSTGPEQKRPNLNGADVIAVFQEKKMAIDQVLSLFVKGNGQITSEDVIDAQKSLPKYAGERKIIDGMRKALEKMARNKVAPRKGRKEDGWTLSGLKKRTV
jgi:hypothetical protein